MTSPTTPDPVVLALDHVRGALADAARLFADLRGVMLSRTEQFRKVLVGLVVVMAIQVILAGTLLFMAFANREILGTVREVTDPRGQYQADARDRTRDLLVGLSEEDDCRARRALIEMPAPDPTKSCKAQTPQDVYPG